MTVAPSDEHPLTVSLPAELDLVLELERAFRLLGRRVYLHSPRAIRDEPVGVDRASFALLTVLEEHDDRRPSEIAASLELDVSTVSRHVNQLEGAGFIDRRPDHEDRRACRISLTDAGRHSLAAGRQTRTQVLGAVFDGWPERDRAELLRLLTRLLEGVPNLPSPAPVGTAAQTRR